MYSDIRKVENGIEKLENVDEIKIPFSLTYEYGDVNRFNPKKEKELEEALKEAEKPENMVSDYRLIKEIKRYLSDPM